MIHTIESTYKNNNEYTEQVINIINKLITTITKN